MKAIQRRVGTTFIHVTHDEGEAMATADRIVVMSAGQTEDVGLPAQVYLRPRPLFGAGFMGEVSRIPVTGGQSPLGPILPGTGTLVIRPEAIGPEGTLPPGPAHLIDSAFFGTHQRVHFAPLAAPDMILTVHLPQGMALAPGTERHLGATSHVLLPEVP